MKTVFVLLFVALLVVPMVGVQAQGIGDLSEEEQALLERFFEVSNKDDDYSSFAISSVESVSVTISVDMGVMVEASQSGTRTIDAYVVRDGDLENAAGTTSVEYSSSAPDGSEVSYSIAADVVFLDETLYVDAEFLDSEGEVGEIEPGWQVYDTADAIPDVISELDLDNLFDEGDDEDNPFEDQELIESAISSVTLEEDELDDGRPVEIITLIFEGDGAAQIFSQIAESDDSGNPFVEIMYNNGGESSVMLGIAIDEDENLVGMAIDLSLSLDALDLTPFNLEGFPEGATLTASVENTRIDILSDIDSEFDPIEVPIE